MAHEIFVATERRTNREFRSMQQYDEQKKVVLLKICIAVSLQYISIYTCHVSLSLYCVSRGIVHDLPTYIQIRSDELEYV